MPNGSFSRKEKIGAAVALGLFILFFTSFSPHEQRATNNGQRTTGACNPNATPFYGYTFLYPDLVNKNAAYAPFLLRWDDYYEQYYFGKDIQKEENIREWIARFCGQPDPADVEYVVYQSNFDDLVRLHDAAADPKKKRPLPYSLAGNTFAEMLALNGCMEVIEYLMYAKKCEPYVVAQGDGWKLPERDLESMHTLIEEGMGRFAQTNSHFVRLRYTFQIVRLAHYARNWEYTEALYNYLIPKIDLQKSSIVYFWTVGHLAGALQKMGKYPEAAYRYSLVFRQCPSKRVQAYRSFLIRNDRDWEQTLRLCQSDTEKATLYVMRAAGSHSHALEDLQQVLDLDPLNPQLELLLVSDVQELEKIFLRTATTDKKYGAAIGSIKRQNAERHLLDLQKFVREAVREKRVANLNLWKAVEGYLELLAGDRYAAYNSWERLEKSLKKNSDANKNLLKQLGIWRCVLDVMNLDTMPSGRADSVAYQVRSYNVFKENPNFEPFLQDWLSQGYAFGNHPGKAILAAYPPSALGFNPSLAVLDDLLKLSESKDPILLERTMMIDTNPDRIRAQLLEVKGAYLLSLGQPEAALATLRLIKPSEEIRLPKFRPFREKTGEKVHRLMVDDSLILNRRQIAEHILDFEFRAKAAEAVGDPVASWYYYLIGLGYYNMSYFGYEWEVTDFYRSGYNQLRLAQGPVFPFANSPNGNRENLDMSVALSYFEKAYRTAKNPEFAARAVFMAARCQQKQWFCDKDCNYRPGSKLVPVLPEQYMGYYDILTAKYSKTKFYELVVKQCKWLEMYAR